MITMARIVIIQDTFISGVPAFEGDILEVDDPVLNTLLLCGRAGCVSPPAPAELPKKHPPVLPERKKRIKEKTR